jgi:hypothetical protein
MDADRLEQFANTKRTYDKMVQSKEFIIPTRNEFKVGRYIDDNSLYKDVHIVPYRWNEGFNSAKALNLGVRNAKYDNIIITSPEVLPKTDVLGQLEELLGQNVVCQVWDEDESHKVVASLVYKGFRDMTPAMYFLAMFNKQDIEAINGWDEAFMQGYAYEDDDFGQRWVRAGLPFQLREDIQGVHQYHKRGETIPGGANINYNLLQANNSQGITRCANGLISLDVK